MLPTAAPTTDTRISTLVGDRMCIRCGYNLVGQPIVREGHYNMLIVRCPECATVASVQEYPLLGRWANRWAALLAALWLLILVALWIGVSLAVFGLSLGSAEIASSAYTEVIANRFNDWQQAQAAIAATQPASNAPVTGPTQTIVTPAGQVVYVGSNLDFATWWKSQDKAALLAQAGGWRSAFSWWLGVLWFWMAITCVALGCVWATLLLARGRRGLLVVGVMIVATAGLFAAIQVTEWLTRDPNWFWSAAETAIGPPMIAASLVWGLLWLWLGLMIGRPVVRGLILLMLPPRMRGSLAALWLTDGLEPPGTKRQNVETSKRQNT